MAQLLPPSEDNSPGTRLPSATGLGKALGGRVAEPRADPQGRLWLAWPCGYRWRGAAGTALPESAPPASHSSGCRRPTPPSPTCRQTGQKVEGRWDHRDIPPTVVSTHWAADRSQRVGLGFRMLGGQDNSPSGSASVSLCGLKEGQLISPLSPHLKNGYNAYLNPSTLHILGQAINPPKPQLPHLYIRSLSAPHEY